MVPNILLCATLIQIGMCHLLLKRQIDFRQRFLERRREREIKDQLLYFDQFDTRDTESLDGIIHYKFTESKSNAKWRKTSDIENDFRRLIAMEGMKYNYKRDMYWRTWRKVLSANGVEKIVCYKCNYPIVVNATGCQNCGMWTIEEGPSPCPYEFFSVIDESKLCGANYTQFNDVHNSCPSVIKFSDLTATCDNPIETIWRFSKLYGASGEFDNVICDGKDYCEIYTSYEISPQQVTFRIINSSNDVMYSRIMKPNKTNYICVEDCGRFNPNTRNVIKNDRPLKLDLSPKINLREGVLNETMEDIKFDMQTTINVEPMTDVTNKLSVSKNGGKNGNKKKRSKVKKRQQSNSDYNKNIIHKYLISLDGTLPKPTPISHCKKMQNEDHTSYEEENEEYIL